MPHKYNVMQVLCIAVYVTTSSAALLLIKLGSGENRFTLGGEGIGLFLNNKFMIGLLLYILSFCLFTFKIVNFAQLNTIYPIAVGLGLVVTFILSVVVLHETVSIHKLIAFLMIVAGCVLINVKS